MLNQRHLFWDGEGIILLAIMKDAYWKKFNWRHIFASHSQFLYVYAGRVCHWHPYSEVYTVNIDLISALFLITISIVSQILNVKPGEDDYADTSYLLRQASPYMKIRYFPYLWRHTFFPPYPSLLLSLEKGKYITGVEMLDT